MIRLLLGSLVLLGSGTCLSTQNFQPPISVYVVYGWEDGNCIDTASKCLPLE